MMEDKKGHRKQEVEEVRRGVASGTDREKKREGCGQWCKDGRSRLKWGFLGGRGEWKLGWKGKEVLDARLRGFALFSG